MNASVFFLALRRMRAPLIVLIVIYALSTLGLTLIPGIDAQGQPAPPMSFFHAFYFVSYTASTIGFGELPVAFSEGATDVGLGGHLPLGDRLVILDHQPVVAGPGTRASSRFC
jgi:hypothetical protein